MRGSDRFLLNYLRALVRLLYGWLQSIWVSVWATRLSRILLVDRIRKESRSPLVPEWSGALSAAVVTKERQIFKSEKSVFRYEEIPMPKGWPLIGTILDLIAAGSAPNLHKYIDKRHQQFGHIFRERLGSQEAVFVSSANLMRSVFLYEGQYPTHPLPDSWVLFNKLHNCQRGLFFMDGPEWHTNRKIMNRILLNGNLDWMNVHIDHCTEKLIDSWKTAAGKSNGYYQIQNLEGQLYRWSIDVVCAIMFGYGPDNASNKLTVALDEFSKIVHKVFENSSHLMNFPPKLARALHLNIWTQFEKNVTRVLEMGYDIIDLHMHMKLDKEEYDDDGLFTKMRLAGISLDVIKRIFVDLIIAAGDTTAFSSQWAFYLMSQNKEIQEKICAEYLTHRCEGQTVLGLIKEMLRLYPVAPFIGRFLASDAVIGDYEIRKNTMVILSLYTSGRDPDHFPDPLTVKPDRWFRNSSTGQLTDVLQPHGTLPFAIGSRSCIGKKVALYQMHCLMSAIACNFDIKCFNKQPVDVVLRLVTVPNQPLEMGVKVKNM